MPSSGLADPTNLRGNGGVYVIDRVMHAATKAASEDYEGLFALP
jgi:hypothetical protein